MGKGYEPRYSKGQKIGGRYLVHQPLLGGMGEVYLCLDEETFLPYALKTCQGSDLGMRALFESEVANWIALEKHPHIVRLFYMDTLDSIPFMVLEWVASDESKGTDLRSWLRYGALPLDVALKFTIDMVRGLQHANEKSPGIVHRDLKPDNVLVNQSRQAKITDFGLATVVQHSNLSIQSGDIEGGDTGEARLGQSMRMGNVVGTPAYMPPEQWSGERDLDFRTDIYAVGCVLYELLTGSVPFRGRTISELRTKHTEAPWPDLNTDFPAELKPILAGCLAKERAARYETLDLLFSDLKQVFEQQSDEPLVDIEVQEFTAVDYNNRGTSYSKLGQNQRAIQDYDEAIQLAPNYALSFSNRGKSYGELGQHELAIQDYNEAIRLDPNFALAYYNRGHSYDALRQPQRAIQDYNEAIRLNPNDNRTYSNRGKSHGDSGQHELAIQNYDEAIRLDPTDATAYANRGTSYASVGQHERAIQDYDEAIQLDPNNAKVHYKRGTSYIFLGQYQRAIQDYDEAIRLDPSYARAYSNRGISYGSVGQYERAIEDYDEAIRLDSDYAEPYFNKGSVLAKTGRLQESLPLFEKAYSLGVQQAAGVIQKVRQSLGQAPAQVQINTNDPEAALEAFALANSPEAMQQAIQQFSVLAQMIPTIQQFISEQIPAEEQFYFEHRLLWLKLLVQGEQPSANEQEQVLRKLVALYQEYGEEVLKQIWAQQGVPEQQIKEMIAVVKQIMAG